MGIIGSWIEVGAFTEDRERVPKRPGPASTPFDPSTELGKAPPAIADSLLSD
jgi:hypothetical protein